MTNETRHEWLAAWRAMLEAHAEVTAALERDLLAGCGLPLAWYDVLAQLHDAPGRGLRMQELARAVLLSKSGLTRLVDRMEQAGLVVREPDPDDRRGTRTALTSAGRAALRRAAPVHVRGVQRHFARHLEGDEARVLLAACARIVAAARAEPAAE